MLCIIGRKGSKAVKSIATGASIPKYTGKRSGTTVLVNYGLAGTRLNSFYRRTPVAKRIPTINKNVGYSKLSVVQRAKRAGIKVPDSKSSLKSSDRVEDFIEKRTNSIGGVGIRKARGKRSISGKYYQRFIKNRVYEIRVHSFKWLDKDEWVVQKRVGNKDAVAWNYKQGGRFMTVSSPGRYDIFTEARKVSEKILDMLGMSFGAVDFIVDRDYNLWFLEVNAAPGFTELSEHIYIKAFNSLKSMPNKKLLKFAG